MRLLAVQLEPDGDPDALEERAKKDRLCVGHLVVRATGDDEDFGRQAVGLEDLLGAEEQVRGALFGSQLRARILIREQEFTRKAAPMRSKGRMHGGATRLSGAGSATAGITKGKERTVLDAGLGLEAHLLDDVEHARDEDETRDGWQARVLAPDSAAADPGRDFNRGCGVYHFGWPARKHR